MSGAQLGQVYRCPICGAEVTVLAAHVGEFHPVCCSVAMQSAGGAVLYVCPVCGAEIAVLRSGMGKFEPVCCSVAMQVRQAA